MRLLLLILIKICSLIPLLAQADWLVLDTSEVSYLATTVHTKKNTSITELNTFSAVSGKITETGEATFTIDVDAIETLLVSTKPKGRYKSGFKFTSLSSSATIRAVIPKHLLVAQSATADIPATFTLMGQTKPIILHITMHRSRDAISVVSHRPSVVKGSEFTMATSFVKLRKVTGLGYSLLDIPVSFNLALEKSN